MLMDWVLPRAGMMLAFLLLWGVVWSAYEGYDLYAANREAHMVAVELADQIAMVANVAPEYSYNGYTTEVPVPEDIHGAPYKLSIDSSQFQVRIEVLGRYQDKVLGIAFLPVSAVEGGMLLQGFEIEDSENVKGYIVIGQIKGLRIARIGSENRTLRIEAFGAE
ncbi:MAG: hypothetical protein V3T58_03090 [Candidatus Hydrothermarchaeales archaeon]